MALLDAPLMFWIAAAILTAGAVIAALWPMLRSVRMDDQSTAAGTRQVLIDQLDEIRRDRERGLLNEEEADSARAEVGRRLLALERENGNEVANGAKTGHRIFQAATILLIPLAGLGLYALTGQPGLPDQPFAQRQNQSVEEQDIHTLIANAEKHLASNPNDLQGWLTLAPIYVSLNRLVQAEDAYRQILSIGPDDKRVLADVQSNLAQILARNANGAVTPEAIDLFRQAQVNNPIDPSGFFFEAIYFSQNNERDEAITAWERVINRFGADNPPWLAFAEQSLAVMRNGPQPSEEDVAAAESMTPEEQREFIESMVQRLADRLEEQPDDLTGWSRLVQSYMILERRDDAVAALARAREAFSGNDDATGALDALAKEFNL